MNNDEWPSTSSDESTDSSSSDESTSTESSFSSSDSDSDSEIENQQKFKSYKCKQWEKNLISNFVLKLYHRLVIKPENNWMIKKCDMHKEFTNYLTTDMCGKIKEVHFTDDIGAILLSSRFVKNIPWDNDFYKIKSCALFQYRKNKLSEQDSWRIYNSFNKNDETCVNGSENILQSLVQKKENIFVEENVEVDTDGPKNLLEYQGILRQKRVNAKYNLSTTSCLICQTDFATMKGYNKHIITHNAESEFEFLDKMMDESPIFTLSYRLCKNSHYFCFDIETKTENLIIERIIIVQSHSMYYVNNMRVPYNMPETGCDQFFVDCDVFTTYLEQPIVLICYLEDDPKERIIEQHHFYCEAEFPKLNFAINSYRLPNTKTFKQLFQPRHYFPSKKIQMALNNSCFQKLVKELMTTSNEFRQYLKDKYFQPQTIVPALKTLLHIEDFDSLKECVKLVQNEVKFKRSSSQYNFKPNSQIIDRSLLCVGDELVITLYNKKKLLNQDNILDLILTNENDIKRSKDMFIGQIEEYNSRCISFKCYKKIDVKKNYTVICRPIRLYMRQQYRALDLLTSNTKLFKKFLFPEKLIPGLLSSQSLSLYNKSIYDNPEQLQAVRNIAEGPRNDATYIIFGPPGTGKTTTMVEAILQVLKRKGTKILVTASSNSACDEVALRLCQTLSTLDMTRAITRIYARSREKRADNIDDELLDHSNMYSGQFYPDIEVLHEYRIVVCTLAVVGKLATGKFGNAAGYTHLFIDEIGASMESEALVALTSILTSKSSLIIAGDHKQLGPVLLSKRAEKLGLGVSLMERLLARDCYRVNTDTGDYDRTIQTRLRLNFRSHPDIVNLYSGLYYNNDLESKAKIDDVSLVKHWHLALNKEYPIIFHCVTNKYDKDYNSRSLYNMGEIEVVMDYVKDLMYFGINGKPAKETDIGIISPYRAQFTRIQEELNLRKWFKIETGSVETFQGQEKHIIICSFVRSGTRRLGFLVNPRRLNVTISRAKSLLIMIGNPKTLSLNRDYAYLINECKRHKSMVKSYSSGIIPWY